MVKIKVSEAQGLVLDYLVAVCEGYTDWCGETEKFLDSYCSCSHGAGRTMSREKARKTFTVADLQAQTEGVECRKDDAVLDEIPGAYKNIDQVMANQADLVEVVHTLKQVLCVKGA